MDKIDRSILSLLQENARMANSEIAKKLGMASSAIWERIKKLEDRKIIQKYSAIIEPEAVDFNILAYVTIRISAANWTDKCSKLLAEIKNIEELHEVLGEDSYWAKVRAKDMAELSKILKDKIGVIPEISSTKTVVVINSIKDTPYPNLNQSNK